MSQITVKWAHITRTKTAKKVHTELYYILSLEGKVVLSFTFLPRIFKVQRPRIKNSKKLSHNFIIHPFLSIIPLNNPSCHNLIPSYILFINITLVIDCFIILPNLIPQPSNPRL